MICFADGELFVDEAAGAGGGASNAFDAAAEVNFFETGAEQAADVPDIARGPGELEGQAGGFEVKAIESDLETAYTGFSGAELVTESLDEQIEAEGEVFEAGGGSFQSPVLVDGLAMSKGIDDFEGMAEKLVQAGQDMGTKAGGDESARKFDELADGEDTDFVQTGDDVWFESQCIEREWINGVSQGGGGHDGPGVGKWR